MFVTTFASHVHRLQAVADLGVEHGRKVALVGSSMLRTTEVAEDLGLLRFPAGSRVEAAGHYVQGLIDRQARRHVRALEAFERAIGSFEKQTTTVGGAHDVRSSFAATGATYSREAAELALSMNRPSKAFEILIP